MHSALRTATRGEAARNLPAPSSRTRAAWRDLTAGAVRSWMWSALALQDIKLRYRGSVLGPFWLTISTVVMVVAMGAIYANLFHVGVAVYLPYLTIGLIAWQFIAAAITEGCETFLKAESVIQQVPIPFSIHAYRVVCRNLLVLGHSFVIIPIVLAVFREPIDWHVLGAVAGVVLLALNALWVSILLGMVSARFRDVPPIVASFLQVTFFVTPVFWPIDSAGRWKPLLALNPLFAAIDVIRAPLLGAPVAVTSWPIVLATTLLGCAVTFALFARFRTRIAYWM